MSDHWIILIPEDPRFVPDGDQRARAKARLGEIAPDAQEIEVTISEKVEFFDCGGNFERIRCPACREEISVDWWGDRMNEDFSDEGFKLAEYPTPCCGANRTMHDLIYEWPEGLGRFSLQVMNANIGRLDEAYKTELEAIVGTPLRVIYQRV